MVERVGVILSDGAMVPVDLPPFSAYPRTTDPKAIDQAGGIAAALNTNLFPVLRERIISAINKNLAAWA